jgi:hypothetical protein
MVHLTDAVQVRIRHLPSSWKTLSVPRCVAARIHRLESECSKSESLENEGSVNRHQYTVGYPLRGDKGTKIQLKENI